jgi:hypothetical protein
MYIALSVEWTTTVPVMMLSHAWMHDTGT